MVYDSRDGCNSLYVVSLPFPFLRSFETPNLAYSVGHISFGNLLVIFRRPAKPFDEISNVPFLEVLIFNLFDLIFFVFVL